MTKVVENSSSHVIQPVFTYRPTKIQPNRGGDRGSDRGGGDEQRGGGDEQRGGEAESARARPALVSPSPVLLPPAAGAAPPAALRRCWARGTRYCGEV